MIKTLEISKTNWIGLVIFFLGLKVIYFDISWWSFLALLISAYQFILLFNSFGKIIPIRHLFGSLMCLQMLVGPAFAFCGLDKYQVGHFRMQVAETDYFIYVLPAVVLFIAGLHLRAAKNKGEELDMKRIVSFVDQNPILPVVFIVVGFVSSYISQYVGTEFAFLLYLIGGLKFIGLFLIILSNKGGNTLSTLLVYGSIIATSISTAMFHDLLTWVIFLIAILCLRYRPSFAIKLFGLLFFVSISIFIQMIKGDYRDVTWKQDREGDLETLGETVQIQAKNDELFSFEKLAQNNIRINQGAIVSNIMNNIPAKMNYAEGDELVMILESAFLPRILSNNKLKSGDRDFFMKWSGMIIGRGASMGLSSVGDAYINFGIIGGMLFMFLYGMFFSEVLLVFHKNAFNYPILFVISPLVFYYPIRPDCELHTLLGHLVKSCFLIFIMLQLWKSVFKNKFNPQAVH